jgi:hypothetical protein
MISLKDTGGIPAGENVWRQIDAKYRQLKIFVVYHRLAAGFFSTHVE